MPGWSDAVRDILKDSPLCHLGVYRHDNSSYAQSDGFSLSRQETLFILKHMSSANSLDLNLQNIRVNGVELSVDAQNSSGDQIHATGPVKDGKNAQMESVWIVKTDRYILVGVAPYGNDIDCKAEVLDLMEYIRTLEKNSDDEVNELDNVSVDMKEALEF